MMTKIRIFAAVVCITLSTTANGQNTVERTDWIRSNGLIYIVLGVLAIIFVGMVVYLLMLDRKLAKIEHTINADKHE